MKAFLSILLPFSNAKLLSYMIPESNEFEGDEFIQMDLPVRNETDDLHQLLKTDKHGY